MGCDVMTMGDVPISMIGARSLTVSNCRLGSTLGLTAWVSNTSRNVVPSGGDVTAACVPIAPPAPARFSMTIVVLRSAWSSGWTRRAIWSVVPPGGNGTMNRIGLAGPLWASYLLIVTSFGGLGAVNLSSARLDARDQLSTELDRVV